MAEGSKLRKFKTGLKERFKDIAGDMQDMRDEGLHSLNELKVEYQVNKGTTGSRDIQLSENSAESNFMASYI